MNAHHVEATLTKDRELTLTGLPFPAGADVEVIIMERRMPAAEEGSNPLRGKILRYDDPTEPVAVDDWDALR